jgi:hypothetical protein
MSSIIRQATRNTRKPSCKIVLAVGAFAAMVAGTMAAAAQGQQAGDVQRDDATNWRAIGGRSQGAYAYDSAPAPHRSSPYASARSDRPAAAAPHRDFQMYK